MQSNGSDYYPRGVKEKTSGEADSEEEDHTNCKEAGYYFGDAVFGTFVVAPLVVIAWKGTWGLMELQPKMFPYIQIFILGIVIHVTFAVSRSHLFSRSRNAWGEGRAGRWLRERLLCRIYTYVFLLSCIMHWRGGWGLFDAAVNAITPDVEDPHRPMLIAALTLMLYLSVTCLRTSRNLLASPYFLCADGKEDTYLFTTRFKVPASIGLQ